ncbi:beta-ketoacyl synthase chain length factor [Pectobacterium fontis]|uniref:Beta-ketoacyl synthase, N-terminal domain protein n=1 Tax=Pectobacterium fontis TaxID=2558042 RepID=A0A7V8L6C5_9GAMM|nr:beta-ketoacyl synthase chain length factor [Pectobacterium fontis]KHN54400.1 beta-ketoacyl synthase, N-terminal domain protein [Pectobacterium fontis]
MRLAFSIIDWQASAPGLSSTDDWLYWSRIPAAINTAQPLDKGRHLPMMMARRLNQGSRLAVDSGLALLSRQSVDAIVFTSRHGELERNLNILNALAHNENISPTDFAMSVHNAAVGSLTITAKAPLVSTSIAAGMDSFQQGLIEAKALQAAGYRHILLVDFDGAIPDFYHPHVPVDTPRYPYAVALLLGEGDDVVCESRPLVDAPDGDSPQSLLFLHAFLARTPRFSLSGERVSWAWERRDV